MRSAAVRFATLGGARRFKRLARTLTTLASATGLAV